MTKKIFITPKASQDIDDHFAYISVNNSDAAAELDRGEGIPLETAIEQLQDKFRQGKKLENCNG